VVKVGTSKNNKV